MRTSHRHTNSEKGLAAPDVLVPSQPTTSQCQLVHEWNSFRFVKEAQVVNGFQSEMADNHNLSLRPLLLQLGARLAADYQLLFRSVSRRRMAFARYISICEEGFRADEPHSLLALADEPSTNAIFARSTRQIRSGSHSDQNRTPGLLVCKRVLIVGSYNLFQCSYSHSNTNL